MDQAETTQQGYGKWLLQTQQTSVAAPSATQLFIQFDGVTYTRLALEGAQALWQSQKETLGHTQHFNTAVTAATWACDFQCKTLLCTHPQKIQD